MTPLFPERPPRLRTRRRKVRVLTAAAFVLVVASLIGGTAVASHIERLAIRDVFVSGVEALSRENVATEVRAALESNGFEFFSSRNIFLYPKSEIEETLSREFPRIKEVRLSRESLLAQAVIVSVQERDPFAVWCHTSCYAMDAHGFIYAEGDDEPSSTFTFRGGLIPNQPVIGQWFLRGRLHASTGLLEQLASAGFSPQGITVDSETDFSIPLAEGPVLRVAFDMSSGDVVRNLETALSADSLRDRLRELEYIDLRFGNRVYYK